MLKRLTRRRPSAATILAGTALFVALAGTSYAATPKFLILGQANTASSTTELSAPTAGPALQLTNTSTSAGATALGLAVASGKPPLTVNSAAKVANLNADQLDGFDANGLVRVAQGTHATGLPLTPGYQTLDTVDVTAPTAGFVLVTSTMEIDYRGPSATGDCPCNVQFFVQRDGTAMGQLQFQTIYPAMIGVSPTGNEVTSTQYVFPVSAGAHTFDTQIVLFAGDGQVLAGLATITALFVPFDGTGAPGT